jgi:very-short-patch-repair endonuclease
VWEETAAAQAGLLTRRQALDGGLTDEAIEARLASGRWQRLHAGIVATFSGPASREAQLWAGVLACGPDAVLSHETAAELAGLLTDQAQMIHVTVPAERRVARRPELVVHRSRLVAATRHPALRPPRTRIEDTVVDLTQTCPNLDAALGWLIKAVASRLTTAPRLLATVSTRHRLRWRALLEEALNDVAHGCHSMLELHYLRGVERLHGLPKGIRQRRRGRWYDDVEYEEYGVCVELDGRAAHPQESAFRDHRRDNAAVLAGLRVLRYGHADVMHRPCLVAREVAAVLLAAGWRGKARSCGVGCQLPR